jgi:hypothetical protein
MGREEIAAAQKLELAQAAEREIAETRREGRQARERVEAAAAALSAQLGLAAPVVEPVSSEERASEAKPPPPEAPNFADIADRIVAND